MTEPRGHRRQAHTFAKKYGTMRVPQNMRRHLCEARRVKFRFKFLAEIIRAFWLRGAILSCLEYQPVISLCEIKA